MESKALLGEPTPFWTYIQSLLSYNFYYVLPISLYYFKFVSKFRNSQVETKHLWNWIKLHSEIELIVVIQWIGLKSLRAESRDQKKTQTVKLLT